MHKGCLPHKNTTDGDALCLSKRLQIPLHIQSSSKKIGCRGARGILLCKKRLLHALPLLRLPGQFQIPGETAPC